MDTDKEREILECVKESFYTASHSLKKQVPISNALELLQGWGLGDECVE